MLCFAQARFALSRRLLIIPKGWTFGAGGEVSRRRAPPPEEDGDILPLPLSRPGRGGGGSHSCVSRDAERQRSRARMPINSHSTFAAEVPHQ